MGKPPPPQVAKQRNHHCSLLAVGGLPPSEAPQRPGGQRPCFRQVGIFERHPRGPAILHSDGDWGQQGGVPQILSLNLPLTLVLLRERSLQNGFSCAVGFP